jgi:hypothetical protein
MISKADCDRCAAPGTRDAGISKEDGERAEGERGAGDGRGCGRTCKVAFFFRGPLTVVTCEFAGEQSGCVARFPRDCSFPQVEPAAGERYPGDATLNPNQDSVRLLF